MATGPSGGAHVGDEVGELRELAADQLAGRRPGAGAREQAAERAEQRGAGGQHLDVLDQAGGDRDDALVGDRAGVLEAGRVRVRLEPVPGTPVLARDGHRTAASGQRPASWSSWRSTGVVTLPYAVVGSASTTCTSFGASVSAM